MPSPDGIRGILFDAGNTLVQIDVERMVSVYSAAGYDLPTDDFTALELQARHVLHTGFDEWANGMEDEVWDQYFQELLRLTRVPEAALPDVVEGIRSEHGSRHLWSYPHLDAADAVTALADAGYRLGVISNADGRMEGALVDAGLRDSFEFVIDSGQVGVEKPDAAIFHAGCDALGMEPPECLYVGDLYPVDYVGSRRAGLSGVLLDPLGIHVERAATVSALGDLGAWLEAGASATPTPTD